MSSLIKLNHASKTFKSNERLFTALANIDLSVNSAEFLAIVGKSGSGKSTLLNLISGIDYPTDGEVIVSGQNISQLNETQLAQWRGSHIGIVFQFFQLIPTLTVIENLLIAMEFVGKVNKSSRTKKAMDLLGQVGIAEHWNKFPTALSGGEQQRAAIARALANDPQILIADEPTGNLDNKTAEGVHKLLKDLAKKGTTVIVVTHDREKDQTYDRIITLSDGHIQPTPKAVCEVELS